MDNYQLEDSLAHTDNALDVVKDEVRDLRYTIEQQDKIIARQQVDVSALIENVKQLYEVVLPVIAEGKLDELSINGLELKKK